jgi:hypothetical protein
MLGSACFWSHVSVASYLNDSLFIPFWGYLGALAKLWKTTASFVRSVRLSVRLEQFGSHWMDFHEIWCLFIFRKYVQTIKASLMLENKKVHFTWTAVWLDHISLTSSYNENVPNKHCKETRNTHFLFNDLFRKLCRLWDNVEKYCIASQATDDNMAHAHCILDT